MNYLEIAGTLVGLLYLWFEYKASIWLWPVSVIMPAIYIVVYYQVGLYADSGISVYYLLAGVYGWWVWLRHVPGKREKQITFTPRKLLAHKYVEQWLVWLVVDVVSCGLYLYKDLYFTSFLYGLYALIAFFGYLKWKQLMNVAE